MKETLGRSRQSVASVNDRVARHLAWPHQRLGMMTVAMFFAMFSLLRPDTHSYYFWVADILYSYFVIIPFGLILANTIICLEAYIKYLRVQLVSEAINLMFCLKIYSIKSIVDVFSFSSEIVHSSAMWCEFNSG